MTSEAWRRFAAVLTALALTLAGFGGAVARTATAALSEIDAGNLPPEAKQTLQLIARGGPYPYRRDGALFGNYERLLPPGYRGYYREYTVATAGARDRGARRIVAGANGERYYTDDHYRTFKRIRE